jgi:transcription elongation factor SPT5
MGHTLTAYMNTQFKDVRFTYTRWAVTTAAKNIINLYSVRDEEEPQWWVEQAFVVTSAVCLVLDLYHRPEVDAEAQEYLACVHRAVRFLQQFFTSSVANHGVRLLLSLIAECTCSPHSLLKKFFECLAAIIVFTGCSDHLLCARFADNATPDNKLHEGDIPTTAPTSGFPPVVPDLQMTEAVTESHDTAFSSHAGIPMAYDDMAHYNLNMDPIAFEDIMDYLPMEGGLDNQLFLDSIFGTLSSQ